MQVALSARKRDRAREEDGNGGQWKGGVSNEGMFEQRPKRKEGENCENVWEWLGHIPGGGDSKCKGPEAGHCFRCLRNSNGARE